MITIKDFERVSIRLLQLHKLIESNYDGSRYVGPTLWQIHHNVARICGLKCWSDLFVLTESELENVFIKYLSSWK